MGLVERNLKLILQVLLLAAIAIVPFVRVNELYFPFVSGKAYVFRALVAAAFFFWVWLLLKDQESRIKVQKLFKNILVVAILVFFLAQVAASFFGVDPVYSLFSSVERADGVLQYGFWVLYFLMFLSVFRENRDWKLFFAVFAIVAVALSVYSWFDQGWQAQLYGVFGNPAYFATFLLFAIGFSLVAFERKFFYPGLVHYGFLVAAGFFVVTLVFTQVRGVYVALAGGVLLFFLLAILFLRKENKKLVFFSGLALLLGLSAFGGLFAAKNTEYVQHTRLLYRITEVTEIWEKGSTRERLLNWSIALKAFRERPLFGYGPENYASAANRYYDYRIGKGEPWFDRAHNQPLDTLATGGIAVFAFYAFWLGSAAFLIFKIAKKRKILSFLLASLFLAYFIQGFFLFDLLAVYLGLFPFLAFLIYEEQRVKSPASASSLSLRATAGKQNTNHLTLVPVALVSLALIYFTVVIPWQANAAVLKFYAYSESKLYRESIPFLKEAMSMYSPYTTWEVRKRAGWQLSNVLEYEVHEDTKPEQLEAIKEIYEFMTPELEKFLEARPSDPQIYYVLGRTYRLGSEKLGYNDLDKAATVFQKAFQYSDLRVEYFNEFSKVLLSQGRVVDAEQALVEYTGRLPREWGEYFSSLTMGHFYFAAKEYDKALEHYEKARETGYSFVEVLSEYSRYLFVAEETKNYEKIIAMAKAFLARWGPDADTYFNIAVGYLNLGDRETGREFFRKAIVMKPEYKEYNSFFK